jgi:hypothetical protein
VAGVSAPTFEVLAFRALPVTSAVAVLELEGRFSDRAPVRLGRPSLLVEAGRERFELLPTAGADAAAGPGGVPWRASFALSAAFLAGASFALEVGRDLLVDLPAPDLGTGDRDEGERLARLARDANDLRRRLDEAALRVSEAEAAAQTARLEAAAETERAAAARAAAEEEAARQVEAVRAQSDLLLEQARAEAEAALAAERERHEREVAAVREQANHSLATAEDEAAQAIAAVQARAEAERARHERELAAVREQADRALATALREQEANLAPGPSERAPEGRGDATPGGGEPRAAGPDVAAPTPGPSPGGIVAPADAAPQPAQRVRPTTAAGRLWRRDPFVDDPGTAATEVVETGNDETVRFLSGRRRPRHSIEDEREPATLPAGATRAGARSIGSTRVDGGARRREPQRIGALVALAVAIIAFVLVVVLRVGPF